MVCLINFYGLLWAVSQTLLSHAMSTVSTEKRHRKLTQVWRVRVTPWGTREHTAQISKASQCVVIFIPANVNTTKQDYISTSYTISCHSKKCLWECLLWQTRTRWWGLRSRHIWEDRLKRKSTGLTQQFLRIGCFSPKWCITSPAGVTTTWTCNHLQHYCCFGRFCNNNSNHRKCSCRVFRMENNTNTYSIINWQLTAE